MRCDEAGPLIPELTEGRLSGNTRSAIERHIDGCEDCRAIADDCAAWNRNAVMWDEIAPPPWQPNVGQRPQRSFEWPSFFQWFPVATSAAALVLVAVLFIGQDNATGSPAAGPTIAGSSLPSSGVVPVSFDNAAGDTQFEQLQRQLDDRLAVDQSLLLQAVLEANRTQRQQEMEALVKVLKAEMDKKAFETDESLRYVISHQLQEQERVDELSRELREINFSQAGDSQ